MGEKQSMISKIKYGNSTIQYSVIKSRRHKTSQIAVDKDNVIVRTPLTKSDSIIKDLVKEKAKWIYTKQLEFKKTRSTVVQPDFTDGSKIPYFGKNIILQIRTNQAKNSFSLKNGQFVANLRTKIASKFLVKELFDSWLYKKAQKYLTKRVTQLAKKTGFVPNKIIIKKLRDRWGSATKDNVINLNSNLLKTPKDVIDYVIIHELCHLQITNHSYNFWNLVRKFSPYFYSQKLWLEQNSTTIVD